MIERSNLEFLGFILSKDVKNKYLAGVYYFKKPKKSGKLVIKEKEIDTKEDDFVIFNIADTHYTTKNLSNQSKIVFSVNMKEKKI